MEENRADVFRQLRERMGLKQHELADAMRVHRQSVTRWELGTHPVPEWAIHMARVLADNPAILRAFQEK